MAAWKRVLALENVHAEKINKASVDGLQFVVLKDADEVFVYRDECPHELHPLSEGEIDEGVIICPKHLWEFEVRTGQHITRIPSTKKNLLQYPVRIVEGMIEIDVDTPEHWSER